LHFAGQDGGGKTVARSRGSEGGKAKERLKSGWALGAGGKSGQIPLRQKDFIEEMGLGLTATPRLPVSWRKPLRQAWRWIFLAEVRVQEGEPLENALRRFKRKVQQEDIIKEVKRHSYYLKPGEKKRVKAALARKRNRKKARKEAD
jgi:small subunit ribosomal protein S21